MMTVSQKQDRMEKIKEENVDLSVEVHKSEKLLLSCIILPRDRVCDVPRISN
jgi:hypothetical protein